MTNEPTANDSIDAQTDAGSHRGPEAAGRNESGDESGPRNLLKGAAGALLGLAGISATIGSASAAGSNKRLVVLGAGSGKHTYEIGMQTGGTIQKATHAGTNDSKHWSNGTQEMSGELWQWNVDSYTFSGEVDYVTANGSVSFHFLDGGFRNDSSIDIRGKSSGRHVYSIGSNNADIDLDPGTTEYVDSDDGPSRTERGYTPDSVSGAIRDRNYDSYSIGYHQPVQNITVEEGHLRFA